MRILYITTIGSTMNFFKRLVKELIDCGNQVDIACNESITEVPECYREWGCQVYQISCTRSPLCLQNIKAVSQIRQIVGQQGYDIVHCHTPIASFCTRLACRKLRKKGVKVIYTDHGFHFYKGASPINWVFYPVEWLCSFFTDMLIAINTEDYLLARDKFHAKRTEPIPGVGIEYSRFADNTSDPDAVRDQIGVPRNVFLIASVGELNENKNHAVVIRAIAQLQDSNIHYIIAGEGPLEGELMRLAKELHVSEQIHLLGKRDDVPDLYRAADICAFPSMREGLGLAALEGMASGLPLICTDNRGTREYAVAGENAVICDARDAAEFAGAIKMLRDDPARRASMGASGKQTAGKFDVVDIIKTMKQLYRICKEA